MWLRGHVCLWRRLVAARRDGNLASAWGGDARDTPVAPIQIGITTNGCHLFEMERGEGIAQVVHPYPFLRRQRRRAGYWLLGFGKPSLRSVGNLHEGQHHGNLDQHTDNGRKHYW